MLKFLKGVVGSSGGIKDLPYNIGEPYSSSWGSWTHYRGTSKDDNSAVSIFSLTCSGSQDGRLAAARNGVKRLRTVRHPNVLSFLHSTEVELVDGSSVKPTIYVVTEAVMPLAEKIKELNLEGTQRDEYYAWGLHQIAKAVSFLNNDCKLVHGNICVASVVVTPNLDWKLHAFDVLAEFDPSNSDVASPMLQYEWLVGVQYKPIELVKSDWSAIRKSPPWAIDSWGLGCLIYELFSGSKLSKTEELRNTACIPKTLLPDYQRLLGSTPNRRMNSSKLIDNSEFFQNKLVETIRFMEVLNLKDSVEKDSFFRKLSSLAEQLPRQIVLTKILPMLAASLEFGSAGALALNPLLKMGAWLSPEEFNTKVLPTVIKLFSSSDRGIRIGLLQHIEQFGTALSSQVVDEQVFPHLATGFSDTSAFVRELTLKAMLTLAPKLSQRTIAGSLLKYLSKLQVDEEPAIRTNTTILLGNIAAYLNDGTRKRVLINAFTVRALRDGFAPARAAGIMALGATSTYYDSMEMATRILPHLVVLTVDSDSEVRAKAFEATEQFLHLIRNQHLKVDTENEASVNLSSATTAGASLLGWAMSSLTTKGKVSEQNAATSLTTVATVTNSSHSLSHIAVSSTTANQPSETKLSSVKSVDQIPSSPTSNDGWGDGDENGSLTEDNDKNGWDDLEADEDPAPPVLSRINAAQQRPVQSQKMHNASAVPVAVVEHHHISSTLRTAKGAKLQEDNDPWTSIAAPPPSTAAKPLSTSTSTSQGLGTAPRVMPGQHVSLDAILGNKGGGSTRTLQATGPGRGRGRTAPMKLGVQRINRNSE